MGETKAKTHYRRIFKSDHLSIADLEDLQEAGSELIFTVREVRQEFNTKVAGRKIDANIAYFKEKIKPLVLNATNSKIMSTFAHSSFVEDWKNITIRLYIDANVTMKGEVVGGVRIHPSPVKRARKVITPDSVKMWANAKAAYVRDGNLDKVLAHADISHENQELLILECNNAS